MSPAVPLEINENDLQAVESQDIDDPKGNNDKSVWKSFVSHLSPQACLGPATSCQNSLNIIDNDDCPEFDRLLPPLLKQVKGVNSTKLRTQALTRLYKLTDKERPFNRVPMVMYGSRMGLWEALAPCLEASAAAGDRRMALLLINNLCLPVENKVAILKGESSEIMLPRLLRIIKERMAESYLAAVSLFNLSFYEKSKVMLLTYVPSPTGVETVQDQYAFKRPAENSSSLLRILESVIEEYAPVVLEQPLVHSVQAETTRWSMGVLRNLTATSPTENAGSFRNNNHELQNHAHIIAKTTVVPHLASKIIKAWSSLDLALWKRDSLPDACLMLLTNLVQPDMALHALQAKDKRGKYGRIQDDLKELTTRGGIHALRAQAVIMRLEGKGSYESIVLGQASTNKDNNSSE